MRIWIWPVEIVFGVCCVFLVTALFTNLVFPWLDRRQERYLRSLPPCQGRSRFVLDTRKGGWRVAGPPPVPRSRVGEWRPHSKPIPPHPPGRGRHAAQ